MPENQLFIAQLLQLWPPKCRKICMKMSFSGNCKRAGLWAPSVRLGGECCVKNALCCHLPHKCVLCGVLWCAGWVGSPVVLSPVLSRLSCPVWGVPGCCVGCSWLLCVCGLFPVGSLRPPSCSLLLSPLSAAVCALLCVWSLFIWKTQKKRTKKALVQTNVCPFPSDRNIVSLQF